MEQDTGDLEQPAESPLASSATWDLVADAYTSEVVPVGEHFAREALKLASLPASPHILDVACGPGTLALLAAQEGATVSAIDFSPAMIANLRRRAQEAGLSLADVRVGDGQDLPYADDSFDGIFSINGLVFFPDRGAGFRELHRTLRPGHRAVVTSIASIEGPFAQVLNAIHDRLPSLRYGGDQDPPLGTREEFSHEMSAAGFRDVAIHTVSEREVTPTVGEYWESKQRSAAPVRLLRSKLGRKRWAEVDESVYRHLVDTVGDGPVEEVTTLYLGTGVK
jgi:ubiquinone/menaquinone biosynthesis C-methylase UbiE